MPRLSIHLLGSFQVSLNGEPVSGFASDKVRALLAYLVLTPDRPHRREALAGLLWPEFPERAARNSLRNALANLRQVLRDRDASPRFLLSTHQTIQFSSQSDYWLDAGAFESLVTAVRPASEELEQAVSLAQGAFLEGFTLADAAPFEEWQLLRREGFCRRVVEALDSLTALYEQRGAHEEALPHARRRVELEPWQEEGQSQLMRLLALDGQREAALAQYEQYRQLLVEELGVEPSETARHLYELLSTGGWPDGARLPGTMPERGVTVVGPCPYRGLAAFREEDAPFFFGREAFAGQLFEAVQRRSLVAVVVGSSGSGKTSTVFAGLLPRLRAEADWLVLDARPGSHPFRAVAGAFTSALEPDLTETQRLVETQVLATALQQGEVDLYHVAMRALDAHSHAGRLLLVVDQFEELYTLCTESERQRRFLEVLLAAVQAGSGQRSPLVLLFTLRADFMGQALAHRPFADALQDASLLLGPMNRAELRAAIEKPAELQGAAFETGLVERILDNVGEEPGNLPLLEFALTLLWERQTYGLLTHAGYEEIGQVEGALARYADEVYGRLDETERDQARQILVQLVRPGEGTEDTRRVATRAELGEVNWALVQHLADQRLVVTKRDMAGNEIVEVAHEALIQNWLRFQDWLETDRAFRMWQEGLRAALRQWETSERDEGALLRGAPLVQAEEWLAARNDVMSQPETQFIRASISLRERRVAERQAQRQRELALERHSRLQASIGLASQALSELDGGVPERAIPLALEALEDYPYTWQAEKALGQAVLEHRLQLVLAGHTGTICAVAWSPDGTQIATASRDGTAIVWDGRTGERLATLSGHEERVSKLAWSPCDNSIATASKDGTARLWDAATGEEFFSLSGHEGPVYATVWSPSGDRVVTVGSDATARVWNAATGKELLALAHGAPAVAAAWSPLGSQIAVGDFSGRVIIWDGETGEELLVLDGHEECVNDVSWAPSPDRIITASDDHTARIWDASTGEALQVLRGHRGEVWRALWSPAGDRLVTTALDASARVWDPATGEAILSFDPGDALSLHADVDWSPSGDQVAIIRSDLGRMTVLDVETGIEVLTLAGHMGKVTSLDWSPAGPLVVTASEDCIARVWDVSPRTQVLTGHTDIVFDVAWSPSGDRLAAAGLDGTARIWDAVTGEELLVMRGPAAMGGVMWSPSGDLLVTDPWNADPTVVVWDVSPLSPTYGEALFAMESHYGGVGRSWSSIDERFITTGFDGTARIWDATSGEALLTFEGHDGEAVTSADWSPDGKRVVTSCGDGNALVWDPTTGEVLLMLHVEEASWMTRAAWSPDGKRIATHSDDTIGGRVWDASNSELLLTFTGHTASAFGLDWSATGERLLTVSNDGTARIWDARTGAELLSYFFGPQLTEGKWSPDMKQIALSANDGKVRIVDLHWHTTDELIAYARECCLMRQLTADERVLFGLPPR